MKNLKRCFLGLFSMVLITSCGPQLSTSKLTDKNLNNYDSFAYLPSTNFEVSDKLNNDNGKVSQSIINAMNTNMMRAGYEMDRKNPDLLILLTTTYDKELMRDIDPVYTTYPYNTYNATYAVSPYYSNYYYYDYNTYTDFAGYDVDYSSYKEGTLIVDIIDRKTRNKVWTGTAEQAIFNQDSSEEVASFVDDIFDEYPTIASK